MDWKEQPVFISSTFNDMHAERDYLMKNVFPQLGEWCERRHIILRDIDLRWGVPPTVVDDPDSQNTIYKCLKAVDRSRPFFLCLLGQRRGWVPTPDRISPLTLETFREIADMVRTGSHSATEYEIEHALLMPLACFENGVMHREEPVRCALFLRRRPDYLSGLTPSQKKVFLDYDEALCAAPEDYDAYLRRCRAANEKTYERISRKNLVLDYDCRWAPDVYSPELRTDDPADDRAQGRLTDFTIRAGDLPPALRAELLDLLKKEFPGEVPSGETWPLKAYLLAAFAREFLPCAAAEPGGDVWSRDREQQAAFRYLCLQNEVERPGELRRLEAYCGGEESNPLLVLAEAGMGKTTLLARFVRDFRGIPVLARFLGVSELSGDLFLMWDSLLREAGLPPPEDPEALRRSLPELLAAMAPRVLVLDGLEQVPGGLDLIRMLPRPLPPGIRVILSVRTDLNREELDSLLAFYSGDPKLELQPFDTEQKKTLIRNCLSTSLKELHREPMDLLCSLNESGNPLYLSILLSDIRSFGSFAQLEQEILRHGKTPLSAFDATLSRMENDRMFDMLPPARCVPLVFGLLACARDGLGYEELADCLCAFFPEAKREECAGSLQICLRQVRSFLRRIDGRTDFRHQAFRTAAQQRYAPLEKELRTALARLFRKQCDPDGDGSFARRDQRALREYAWQLSFLSAEEYARLYGDICYLNARCAGAGVRELILEYGAPSLRDRAAFRDLLVRYRDGLENNPDLLPSLLWAYGSETQRDGAGFSRLRSAWVQSDSFSAPSGGAAVPAFEADSLRFLYRTSFTAAAFCFSGSGTHAFAFTEQGRVTAYALENALPLSDPVCTARAMPLGLCASQKVLAAAFENEKIELYSFEAEGTALRSKPLESLPYFPPLYSGAALCFDAGGRLWYQPAEETLGSFDPETGDRAEVSLPGAEEVSSLAAAGTTVWGTACAGRDTLLFSLDPSGTVHTRDLGRGDSRVLFADGNGCLVSCAASGGGYPLQLVNGSLETLREDSLESPVAAAMPLGPGYLLLPAKQALGQLWLWDGTLRGRIEQLLMYQDQARLCALPDGSAAMLSAGEIARFVLEGGRNRSAQQAAPEPAQPEEFPDLGRFELQNTQIYMQGCFACAAGVSVSMRSVRDEQCAGAVFMKKVSGYWHILGEQTWPRALEVIRTVCIDPEEGRFTLIFRSENSIRWVAALQGTAEELCAGKGLMRDLPLSQRQRTLGCFADGRIWLTAGELLQVFDPRELRYETALVLPAPVTAVLPGGNGVTVSFGGQTANLAIQKGVKG